MSTHPVGEVRPSQLLWTYGPGALIDLPNLSVITMGLDRWDIDRCFPLEEARLLAAVKRVLGPQVNQLRVPPFVRDENADPNSAEGKVGVPVRPFPRWLRCVRCGLLAEFDSGLFAVKTNPYRPEDTHFVHPNCPKGNNSDAVPARFLMACRNGHLDDFPWHWFVHGGPDPCKGTLRFFERGASLQTENLWVKCDTCGKARSLVHAFGREAQSNLPACRGRHPHLDTFDSECTAPPRAVLLGATNSWFSVSISVLAIPQAKNNLSQVIIDGWTYFQGLQSLEQLKGLLTGLVAGGLLPGADKFTPEQIWQGIEDHRDGEDAEVVFEGDIKGPEWDVLTATTLPTDWPHFLGRRAKRPPKYKAVVQDVLLLERLREVNALVGYTRVEAPEETADADERPPMASLCKGRPEWVPASEVHGEGIFIRFNEEAISTWEKVASVQRRDRMIEQGHRQWRAARELDPETGYPGIRYVMLHTFAHLLIRELALECGYNAASIRERIYASSEESPMAGVLIYTAAADSDGTLGGLVELGKPDSLERLIEQALKRARVCSSDPLCSEHDPSEDRSLHAAACHSCALVAETSCERGNRYLDRALLVPTFECDDAFFFCEDNLTTAWSEPEIDATTGSMETDDDPMTCVLEDLPNLMKPGRQVKVTLPQDRQLAICDDSGAAPFRFLNDDEEVAIEKDEFLVIADSTLTVNGKSTEIMAGKVIKVSNLYDPETGARRVQVRLKAGKGMGKLELSESEFNDFRPLCIAVEV